MTALEFDNVGASIGTRAVLSAINLKFAAGECVGILGPNGSGKSTLMRAAAGLIAHRTGTITVKGKPLTDWRRADLARTLAYLPQGGQIHWPLSVRNVVALGRLPHGAGAGDAPAIDRAMEACSIADFADRPVNGLSGGERARVLLARALATGASILLADEPFAQLDPGHQLHAMEVLQAQTARGALILVVLHDLSIAARHCSRVILLSGGTVHGDGPPAQTLSGENLRRVFGVDAFISEHAGAPVILPLKRRA